MICALLLPIRIYTEFDEKYEDVNDFSGITFHKNIQIYDI
jgi:hypothetical protein